MNVLMLTNSYTPFVGGLERSIVMFADRLRKNGHRVSIVAPVTPGSPVGEEDVIRVPAVQRFNGTDFSMKLPVPGALNSFLREFRPDIVHSHHPYLIGDTAVRVATAENAPLVFTFHTFFEHYTHYTPLDSPRFKRFVVALATGYCNLCDAVIAPGKSVFDELLNRGVTSPISIVPTGIDIEQFKKGNGREFRAETGIPRDAFVAGIVCRIAPEKNLGFLSEVLATFMMRNTRAHFLMIGDGPSAGEVKNFFREKGLGDRLHAPGTLHGQRLVDGYHAMDVFVFASISETQGLVLVEAMAAGVPVVAVDGPGVRDIILEHKGGRLIPNLDRDGFARELAEYAALPPRTYELKRKRARDGVAEYSILRSTELLLQVYEKVLSKDRLKRDLLKDPWRDARKMLKAEWLLLSNVARAMHDAFTGEQVINTPEAPFLLKNIAPEKSVFHKRRQKKGS
jgi:1,2-diacylglycerol 3-alpha-glucosyltransferase